MNFRPLAACAALLFVAVAGYAQKPTYRNDRTDLPREHAYQQELCRWLGSLTMDQVKLVSPKLRWDGTVRDAEHAGRLWGYFGYTGPSLGTVLVAPENWMVLNDGKGHGIEGSGKVRHPRWGNEAAVFYTMDLPLSDGGQGNPCFRNPAVARRALIATAVDLMMTDDSHAKVHEIARSDFLGGSMNGWLEAYAHCREVLDPKTQKAFEAGFERMVDNFLKWGPRDVNTNMDMRAVASVARFHAVTDDAHVRDKCVRAARRFLFGYEDGSSQKLDSKAGTYYPAGYIAENEGPETTYNGVSYYHLLEARCAVPDDPAWAFLDDVLRAMIEFKVVQYYPDHGLHDGPAGYACRTGNSYVYDQRDRAWRDVAAADLYPAARPLVFDRGKQAQLPTIAQMAERVRSLIPRISQRGASVGEGKAVSADGSPAIWESDHQQHWPPDSPFFSRPGWYERLGAIGGKGEAANAFPYEQPGRSFSRFYGAPGLEEFWAYRRAEGGRDFGFFVEHVPRTWPYGSWAGGSLQLFWTKAAGIVVMATHDKTGDEFDKAENTRVYRVIDQWATDHVWGRASGRAFTTATAFNLDATKVRAIPDAGAPSVTAATAFCDEDGKLCQDGATVSSRFEATGQGIRVTKTISGAIKADELWVTIPIFLRNAQRQVSLQDTVIEGWQSDRWQPLTAAPQTHSRIRLTRDTGRGPAFAYVSFDEPRKVRLSEAPWQASYQSRSRIRNVHIDLLGTNGVAYSIAGEP